MQLLEFDVIRKRAENRKGKDAIEKRLADYAAKRRKDVPSDDRVLAEMARYLFSTGMSYKVIESKWPGIEEAFHDFDPHFLNLQPDDYWHDLLSDRRVIRHGAKINAVRANAAFVSALANEHGSAAKFLLDWPHTDQVGLLDFLAKRGDRLGGMTGQYFLRAIGRENFVISRDVVACLKDAGVPITGDGSNRNDRRAIQEAFNIWAEQSCLPMAHLSIICAQSIDSP
jgi:3-methyladenine DNA glycosylase Tag